MLRSFRLLSLGFGLLTSLVVSVSWTNTVAAQEKKSPSPIIVEATSAPNIDMPYASDRALIAPNMFGNVMGTRWFNVNGPGLGGGGGIGGGIPVRTLSALIRDSVPSDASFIGAPASTTLTVLSTDLNFLGTALPLSNYTSTIPVVGGGQPTLPILEVLSHTAAIQAGLANPGETAVFNAASSQARKFPGATFPDYNIFLVYDFVTGTGLIFVPNPADGGLAGRNRVSADSNPLPRDRVIFNYDFVSNGNLYPTTPAMNRFVLGFEKTFLDGMGSVEVRMPFASTVNSTSNNDGTFGSGRAEVGNLFIVPKVLLFTNDTFVLSTGLGISVPTADDVRLQFGAADVLKIRNEAVILTPFLGSLWTPTDRFFAQSWLGFGFDTGGNPTLTNLDGNGLKGVGRLYDPSTLQLDLQLGYWLVHPSERTGTVRGLAPFVEFHFNHQLQAQNFVTDGPFSLTPSVGQLTEFNLSTGAAVQLGDNANLMLGASFPLTNAQQRFSDWQVGVRLNYFFGPTGRARANLFN